MERVLKTIEVQVTTREEVWAEVYMAAIAAGFSVERAQEQTDRVIELIFARIGPEIEAELRSMKPRRISEHPSVTS